MFIVYLTDSKVKSVVLSTAGGVFKLTFSLKKLDEKKRKIETIQH